MTCNQFVSTCIGCNQFVSTWQTVKNSVCISVKIVLKIFGIYLDFSWTWKDRDTDCLLYDETLQIHSSRVYWLAEVGAVELSVLGKLGRFGGDY